MKPRLGIPLAVVVGVVVFLVPTLVSLQLARRQGINDEKAEGVRYAAEVVRRGEETASQFQRAIQLLNTDHFARAHRRRLNRCGRSPSDQAICGWSPASLVTPWNAHLPAPDAMHVGRPTLTTEHGVHEHMDVHFGPRRWDHLDLIDRDEVAVLVDSTLLIDQQTVGNGVGLTLIVPSSPDHATLTESMHQFQPNWLAPLDRGQSASFLDGGYVVSQVRSRRPPPYRQCPAGTHTAP